MKFNKVLSQLESVYQIDNKVLKPADPLHISDFIHHIFENESKYSRTISKADFFNISSSNKTRSLDMIQNILQESGFLVSRKSILEGIELFKKDFNG